MDVDEARLRAKYRTRADGTYRVRAIAPRGYAIPMDGPVGDLVSGTDISCFRPAHSRFPVGHPGYLRPIPVRRAGSPTLWRSTASVLYGCARPEPTWVNALRNRSRRSPRTPESPVQRDEKRPRP